MYTPLIIAGNAGRSVNERMTDSGMTTSAAVALMVAAEMGTEGFGACRRV